VITTGDTDLGLGEERRRTSSSGFFAAAHAPRVLDASGALRAVTQETGRASSFLLVWVLQKPGPVKGWLTLRVSRSVATARRSCRPGDEPRGETDGHGSLSWELRDGRSSAYAHSRRKNGRIVRE
jgi:hypothetical protein